MNEVYRYIIEDKRDHYLNMMALMPLARTPGDEKGSRAMADYAKSVERMFQDWAPWDRKFGKSELRRKVKSGSIVVIPDATDDPNDPLWKDANILKKG